MVSVMRCGDIMHNLILSSKKAFVDKIQVLLVAVKTVSATVKHADLSVRHMSNFGQMAVKSILLT